MALRRWSASFAGGAPAAALARLNARYPWSHNDHFHRWILANLPQPCRSALDIGCGRGELVAALATVVPRVVGNDEDAAMRRAAVRRCADRSNVVITGESWTEDETRYDVITMIAVLHHLDVGAALPQVRRRLNPGGRFLAVGLAPPVTRRDHAWDVASMITNPIIGVARHPRSVPGAVTGPPPYPVREPTLSFGELRRLLDQFLPGAVLRHRLAFRHTIVWTAPGRRDEWAAGSGSVPA